MAEDIRVLYVEPGKPPRLVTVEHTLENLQKLVGGIIQAIYPWDDYVALVCNDEGKFNGSLPNRRLEDYDVICGPFFICGLGKEDFISIPDDMAQKYMEKFQYPELFFRTLGGAVMCMKLGSGEMPLEIFNEEK